MGDRGGGWTGEEDAQGSAMRAGSIPATDAQALGARNKGHQTMRRRPAPPPPGLPLPHTHHLAEAPPPDRLPVGPRLCPFHSRLNLHSPDKSPTWRSTFFSASAGWLSVKQPFPPKVAPPLCSNQEPGSPSRSLCPWTPAASRHARSNLPAETRQGGNNAMLLISIAPPATWLCGSSHLPCPLPAPMQGSPSGLESFL